MGVGALGGLFALTVVLGGTIFIDGGDGGAVKQIRLSAEAGGLRRSSEDPAASVAYPFITEAVRRGGMPLRRQTAAVYMSEERDILFVGGTGEIADPEAFLDRAKPNTVLAAGHVGRDVCGTFAVLSAVHAYCAWATSGSYGFVASNVPAESTADLAQLVSRMRTDLEG
ncbi:hypothetical protein [Actinomadura gamaensis]|uniref:Uncharacterized protein n=1 Tax=Actinomadura gamaensis TaxID=1763541 RepID=A0ABV9U7A6_9ACTN